MMNVLVLYSTGGTKRDLFINSNFNAVLKGLQKINRYVSTINNKKFQQYYNALTSPYESLSYVNDWKESFEALDQHRVESFNILNQKKTKDYLKKNIGKFDLIVLLHSVLGDSVDLIKPYSSFLKDRKAKVLSFVGNEYSLLKEKKEFLQEIDCDYIASQLPHKAYEFLYSDLNAQLISAPHALNHHFYTPLKTKKINDLTFVGAKYPLFIGDQERNLFIDFVSKKTSKMNNHISIGKNKNLPRHIWRKLLRQSKATMGAEAGTYFLDKDGKLMQLAQQYCNENPEASAQKIIDDVFKIQNIPYVNGKAISSRHFEPIGTKTCQLLIEGHYNGILKENEHYISINKDYSNFDEAFERYLDPKERHDIIENAYEYVLRNHTYDKRVKTILNQIN